MKRSLLILFFLYSMLNATIINVPDDQPTIQEGINVSTHGDTVLVQPGTYLENINYNGKNITLTSMFLTTQDTSYISQTVIDGNQNGSVVTFENEETENAKIIGFKITNGLADQGGGIYCNNSNPIISNLEIINNQSTGNGGGVYLRESNVSIVNVIIKSNSTPNANSYGGGVYAGGCNNINIIGCIISDNFSNYGGSAILVRTLFRKHLDMNIINTTVCNNFQNSNNRGIVAFEEHLGSMNIEIINSIFWNNGYMYEISRHYGIYTFIDIDYSVLRDKDNSTYGSNITLGDNVIEMDPLFVDLQNQNYSIQNISPCIDEGLNNDYLPDLDLYGNPRINFGIVDIGAHEFQQTGDYLMLYSPNGNEKYQINSNELITWSSNITDLIIEFTPDNGLSWITLVDSVLLNQQYNWSVNNILSENCRIRISDSNNPSMYDQSENAFSIWTRVINDGENITGTWTTDISPVIITGEAIVPEDSTLTIEPGVTVKFKTGNDFNCNGGVDCGYLNVRGSIVAEGTQNDSIVFTRADSTGSWGMIFINSGSSECIISHSIIEYANQLDNIPGLSVYNNDFYGAISSYSSNLSLDNSEISNSNHGTHVINHSGEYTPIIHHCHIHSNSNKGILYEKYNSWNSDTIIFNNIIENNDYGLRLESNAQIGVIQDNTIQNNTTCGIYCYEGYANIINNIINYNNTGIHCYDANSFISNNLIQFNSVYGISCRWSVSNIVNNIISNNDYGIMLYDDLSNCYGNLITENISYGIWKNHCNYSGYGDIVNCSIINNQGIGIYTSNSIVNVHESINYFNNTNFSGSNSIIYISNSIYESENLPSNFLELDGNLIDEDPMFIGTGEHPYQLTENSPAIDRGPFNVTYLDSIDLAGNQRISNGRVDIGAFEYQQTGDWLWVTSPTGSEFIESGSSFPITWIRSDTSSTVTIELFDGSDWSTISNSAANTCEYNDWIAPDIDSDDCLIRITDNGNNDISNVSDNAFSIKGNIIEHNEEVSGTWTIDNSPYTVIGKAVIPAGSTLSIEPGVDVKFKTGSINTVSSAYFDKGMLQVNGKLEAIGTSESAITFSRNGEDGYWGMLFFTSTADTSSILSHCNIEFADALITSDIFYGGISFNNSAAIVENCDISNCYFGIDVSYNSHPLIINNKIHYNFEGGIICWSSSSADIIGNAIYNNGFIAEEYYGGTGIFCYSSSPQLINNTISLSVSERRIDRTRIEVNSDEYEKSFNFGTRNLLYGIYCESSNPNITNSLIYGNGPFEDGANIYIESGSPQLSYCLLEDETLPSGAIDEGNNILGVNPVFIDAANENFQLQFVSPCINAGTPDTTALNLPEYDLAGNQRVFAGENSLIDIGAYEYQGEPLEVDFSVDITSGNAPLPVEFTVTSNYPADAYEWDFDNDQAIDAAGESVNWEFPVGVYIVTLNAIYGSDVITIEKENYITSLNSPPYVEHPITSVTFDEDTSDSSLDLNYIFSDDNGDSLSFSYAGNDSIIVEIQEDGIVILSGGLNWFGSEVITFTADDGYIERGNDLISKKQNQDYSKSTRNTFSKANESISGRVAASLDIEITVEPVNDPPILTITGNFEADEDLPSVSYDFSQFCSQVWGENDVLTLSADSTEHIGIIISDFNVVFQSNTDNWSGTEEVTFYLDDNIEGSIVRNGRIVSKRQNQREVVSQVVPVTIYPLNDPPEINLPDNFSFDEGSSLTVNFNPFVYDADGDSLLITCEPADNIWVEIIDSLITFSAEAGWAGSEYVFFYVADNIGRPEYMDSTLVIVNEIWGHHYGDIDDNGDVGAFDAALILRYVVGIDPEPEAPLPWEDWRITAADVSGNLVIGAYDASLVLQYIVGLIYAFPVETFRENIVCQKADISVTLEDGILQFTSNGELYSLNITLDEEIENYKCQDNIMTSSNENRIALAAAYPITGEFLSIPVKQDYQLIKLTANEQYHEIELGDNIEIVNNLTVYPNPFNPEINICFELEKPGYILLEVYNIKGQRVCALISDEFTAGKHLVTWNASEQSSGIYLLQYQSENIIETRKIILLK